MAKKKSSIKVRLILIPLLVVFIAIAGIVFISTYFTKVRLLKEMEDNGLYISEEFISKLESNNESLETINSMIEDKIRVAGNVVIGNQDNLSSERLIELLKEADVAEINWFNKNGKVLYSTMNDYIGWTVIEGHSVDQFMKSNKNELFEEIRKDTYSDNYFKYGYIKAEDGSFVQIGINADKVQELTEAFDYQVQIQNFGMNEEIVYALIVDTNLETIAHSNSELIGSVLEDKEKSTAAIDGIPHSKQIYLENEKVTVFDITYPLVINGELIGAVDIGYSMENVQSAINKNIGVISVTGIIAFVILGSILFTTSKDTIKVINKLKLQMEYLAKGDFSIPVSQALLTKKDELGEISRAVNTMQDSIRDSLKNVFGISEKLAASSQQLASISEQSATTAEEISKVIEEIAQGAADQAKDTGLGADSISILGDLVMQNESKIEELNSFTETVNNLKNQGLELIKELVEKTEINTKSSSEIHNVILTTNESANKIVNASGMIKGIAEQTSLLALNANIEAARAGEAGKGFAVVADEIRKLAEQTNQFTEEINTIILELHSKTSSAVKIMEELEKIVASQAESVDITNGKFNGIASAIEEMKTIIDKISHSSIDMGVKKDDIIGIIDNLSAISQENAAGTEEASASVEEQTAAIEEFATSSEDLSRIAEELNRRVRLFKI